MTKAIPVERKPLRFYHIQTDMFREPSQVDLNDMQTVQNAYYRLRDLFLVGLNQEWTLKEFVKQADIVHEQFQKQVAKNHAEEPGT